MKYGEENECNAMATLVGKVMPSIFPNKIVSEEGFVEIDVNEKQEPFMIVSPDGSIRNDINADSTVMAVELKCPVMDIHKSLPPRYMLQCQAEMEALCVKSLLYLCWKPDYSSVFIVNKNDALYSTAYALAKEIYGAEYPKRQKKTTHPTVKTLKEEINKACNDAKTVEFVGIFQSVTQTKDYQNIFEDTRFSVDRLEVMLTQIVAVLESKYQLLREKATEAVVFLCSSLDRMNSMTYSAPVCWFTKGYSLDSETMRGIVEHVLNVCAAEGIHIPAISFDGQWQTLAVRDKVQYPLTQLQLQKDVWRETEGMKKQAILNEIRKCNTGEPAWITRRNTDNNIVGYDITSKNEKQLPKLSLSVAKQRRREGQKRKPDSNIEDQENDMQDVNMKQLIEDTGEKNDNSLITESSVDKSDHRMSSNVVTVPDGKEATASVTNNASFHISREHASVILKMLKTCQNSNKKGTWNNKTVDDVLKSVCCVRNLKGLRDVDLKVVIRYLKNQHGRRCTHLKESDTKANKLISITNVLGLPNDDLVAENREKIENRRKKSTVKSLKDIAFAELSKMRKTDLNIIYAEYIWPKKLSEWQQKAFVHETDVYSSEGEMPAETSDLFYIPAYSTTRQQYEVSCVDSSHLLTRTRRKCCKGGLDGFPNTAWTVVARSGSTNLSPAMTECIIDQMSVRTALTHFSESVENEMVNRGYFGEASLCRDIREWWRAEDEPGISAKERVQMRAALRRRLLQHHDLGSFPPPGMFVNGWPSQLWEAILSNIDAKSLLYAFTKQKSYNTRAFSSLVGETFFSELTLYDRRGQGTVTASEFQSFIGTAVEKLHIKLDKERTFAYLTSRKCVYPLLGAEDEKKVNESKEEILINDHFFDSKERLVKRSKKREENVSKDRNAVLRGTLGVRWEKARRNDAKLLPTTRMGIDC